MKLFLSLMVTVCLMQPALVVVCHATVHESSFGSDDATARPSPTPDEELERAKRATALAEEKQKVAEAEQAELEARRAKLKAATDPFGDTSKVTVPSGDVKTDQAGFVEVRMLSLEAARGIANRLATTLCKNSGAETLVIYDQSELKAIVFSHTMVTQLQALDKELQARRTSAVQVLADTNPRKPDEPLSSKTKHQLLTESESSKNQAFMTDSFSAFESFLPAAALPGVATGLISSIAQLTNLFRTDTEFKNKDVAIPEDMAVSYIVRGLTDTAICSEAPAIYYPRLYPTNLFVDNSNSPLLKAVNDLRAETQITGDKLKEVANRIKTINEIAGAIDERDGLVEQREKLQNERTALLKTDPHCRRAKCRKLTDDIGTLEGDVVTANNAINKATNNGEDRFAEGFKTWLKFLKKVATETQPLIDAAEEIVLKLDKPDETTNTTALAQLLQAEKLGLILNANSAFMLRVAVSANGTTKIKKNMFIDAKVRHTAGADLVYQLFDHNGRVVMGDAMQFYFDYKSASQVMQQVADGQKAIEPPSKPDTTAALVVKKH
jgi:hypothetical protein